MDINIGANCAKLRSFANELLAACDAAESKGDDHPAQTIDVPMYAHLNGGGGAEVTISVNNDDMEGRDDLDPDLILVDLDD